MWVIFLGPPGCGKGTQSAYLSESNGFNVICMGDIFRENSRKILGDGRSVGEIISSGALIPDYVTIGMIGDEIKKSGDNVLFDGFPRTLVQARSLSSMAIDAGKKIDKVVYFDIDDSVLMKRVVGRYTCLSCGKLYNKFFLPTNVDGVCDICGGEKFCHRDDDNEESMMKRLHEFHKKTQTLIDFYSEFGILCRVSADEKMDDVKNSVLKALCLEIS